MKLSDATTIRKPKPAPIKTKDVEIVTTEIGNKITSFIVTLTGKSAKTFTVKKTGIKAAWLEVEKYCKHLK